MIRNPELERLAAITLTADEFAILPDFDCRLELVRGRIVATPLASSLHGYRCGNVAFAILDYVRSHDLGRAAINYPGIITQRNPDTVRCPDLTYYSYECVPKGKLPEGIGPTPDLAFEVLCAAEDRVEVMNKVLEYLTAGVKVVCVLDPDAGQVAVYNPDELPRRYSADEELVLPELFPDFRVPVRQFLA